MSILQKKKKRRIFSPDEVIPLPSSRVEEASRNWFWEWSISNARRENDFAINLSGENSFRIKGRKKQENREKKTRWWLPGILCAVSSLMTSRDGEKWTPDRFVTTFSGFVFRSPNLRGRLETTWRTWCLYGSSGATTPTTQMYGYQEGKVIDHYAVLVWNSEGNFLL